MGIIQHTNLGVPARRYGYSTDDVGRALVALTQLIDSQKKAEEFRRLITTYMKKHKPLLLFSIQDNWIQKKIKRYSLWALIMHTEARTGIGG